MKKIFTRKRLPVLGSVIVFVGLYLAGLIYSGWHSKQGNLWLMILEIAALPLIWLAYFAVIDWGVESLSRRALRALPFWMTIVVLALIVFHSLGLSALEPEDQRLWAYLPYVLAVVLIVNYAMMKGAEHKYPEDRKKP